MSAFYNGLQGTASRLIAQYGRAVTIETPIRTGDAWNAEVFWSQQTVYAVSTSIDLSEIDGEVVTRDSRAFLIGNANPPPTNECRILDGDEVLNVLRVVPLKPGTVDVMFKVYVSA